jgi:hypothetical protein
MKTILCVILLTLPLLACSPKLSVQRPEQILAGEPSAKVVVVRNYNFYGSGLHYWVTLDGQEIAGLRTKQYVEFEAPEGHHSIGVKWFGGWLMVVWNKKEIEAKLERKNTYYYLLSPTIVGTTEIEEISEPEGLKRIKKSTKVPVGSVGN